MSERLTDEQVATFLRDPLWPNKGNVDTARHLAREVQQWRALIPEVIEQLETWRDPNYDDSVVLLDLETIIAKLREASQ